MFTLFRLTALVTLAVCPPAYVLLREAAVARHRAFNRAVEGEDGDLEGTWHEDALKYVYPW